MMLNKIGFKLGSVIVTLFIIVLLFLGLVMDSIFSGFYYSKMKEDSEELATHLAGMAASHDSSVDNMLRTFAEFSSVSIYLVDANGIIVANSGHVNAADESFIAKQDIQQILQGNSLNKDYTDSAGKRFFVSARPIEAGIHASTVIYVLSSQAPIQASIYQMRNWLILAGAGAFLLALGFTYMVSIVLSKPLIQMEKATRKIAKGDLETRLIVRSHDEIGTLSEAINDLAQDLQRYRDTRQEFFANVSHELRTPITYLQGYAKVLKDEMYDTDEERKNYLDIIHQESLRMDSLIQDLFELAKMEEGKYQFNFEWISLYEVVNNVIQRVDLRAKGKGLVITTQVKGNPPLIYADGLRMEQVLFNLLENAIRYTEQGTIKVSLIVHPNEQELVIEDTGMGIPNDELAYIFDRFYRVEKSRSRQFGGTGLGLAIVKKLVELQNGSIEVSSRAGKGTKFTIHFMKEHPKKR